MMLLFAGCVTPTEQTPLTPPKQQFCLNVSQTVPVTEEICEEVSYTDEVCGIRKLPYTYTDIPRVDLCIGDGSCTGSPLSECRQCSSAMTRCIKVINNEDTKAAGTWTVAATFSFGTAGFNKDPVTATIQPNSSYAFDFYQIYAPGSPPSSASCTLTVTQAASVNDCHQETRTVTECANVTRFVSVEREVCQ